MAALARLAWARLALILAIAAGCAGDPQPTMTPLEIQSMQVREYRKSQDIVFRSMVEVFQDLGYTITAADRDSGLISAQSAASSDAVSKFLLGVTNVTQTRATGFVESIGNATRVRLNFVETMQTSSSYGRQDRHDTPILDAAIYQNAFDRLEQAIFVRSG